MAERDGVVDLRRVEMGPAGARALAESRRWRRSKRSTWKETSSATPGWRPWPRPRTSTRLRALSLRENRISDDGGAGPGPVAAHGDACVILDLTGNMITQDSADRLHEASVEYDWRRLVATRRWTPSSARGRSASARSAGTSADRSLDLRSSLCASVS